MYDDLDVPVIYFNNLDKTVMISQIQILGTYENNLFIWENNINNNIKEGFIRLNKKILDYAWGSNNPFLKKIFLNNKIKINKDDMKILINIILSITKKEFYIKEINKNKIIYYLLEKCKLY